jgi:hypothetical protein
VIGSSLVPSKRLSVRRGLGPRFVKGYKEKVFEDARISKDTGRRQQVHFVY